MSQSKLTVNTSLYATILATCLLMTGCEIMTVLQKPVIKPVQTASLPTVEEKLLESSKKIEKSYLRLNSIETQGFKQTKLTPRTIPDDFNKKVDVVWQGGIYEILKKITSQVNGYKLTVLGKEPQVQIIVSLSDDNITLYNLLKNAGIQAGNRAKVILDIDNKSIILEYAQ